MLEADRHGFGSAGDTGVGEAETEVVGEEAGVGLLFGAPAFDDGVELVIAAARIGDAELVAGFDIGVVFDTADSVAAGQRGVEGGAHGGRRLDSLKGAFERLLRRQASPCHSKKQKGGHCSAIRPRRWRHQLHPPSCD